jgi:hypothetical protein
MSKIIASLKPNGQHSVWFVLLAVSLVVIKRLLISQYGINREAGIELEAIFSVLDGSLIYRDFFWYHGFFPIYWHALMFKIFSPEIYYLRLFVTVFAGIASFFAYRVAAHFLSPGYAVAVVILSFSGLLMPEHVTGEMVAFSCLIASLFYLIDYCKTSSSQSLFCAGLAGGFCTLSQVLPLGIGALLAGFCSTALYGIFGGKGFGKNIKTFLLGYLPIPLLAYGSLTLLMPAKKMLLNIFPMFAGYAPLATKLTQYGFPSLFPSIGFDQTIPQLVAKLNLYLVLNVRYWLIVIVTLWGIAYFFSMYKKKESNQNTLLMLGTLVIFSPLFEAKFLLQLGRMGLTPNYINMLPTYVLLFYLIKESKILSRVRPFLALGLVLVYFLYPFGKYFQYFSKNAVLLDLPYTWGISVTPYKKDLYVKTTNYISANTNPNDQILFTGINRYFSIFSGRHDLFRDNILMFTRAPFYPPIAAHAPNARSPEFENDLESKMKTENPKLILFPEKFRELAKPENSPFVTTLDNDWLVLDRFGDESLKNPYEYESPILIYGRKG